LILSLLALSLASFSFLILSLLALSLASFSFLILSLLSFNSFSLVFFASLFIFDMGISGICSFILGLIFGVVALGTSIVGFFVYGQPYFHQRRWLPINPVLEFSFTIILWPFYLWIGLVKGTKTKIRI